MASPTSKAHPVEPQTRGVRKKRLACDVCHASKVRCSGGTQCNTCNRLNAECIYSFSNVLGRPRNRRSKKKTGVTCEKKATAANTTIHQAGEGSRRDVGGQEMPEMTDTSNSCSETAESTEHNYYDDIPFWDPYSNLSSDSTYLLCGTSATALDGPGDDVMASISRETPPASLSDSGHGEQQPIACPRALPKDLSPEGDDANQMPRLLCDCLKQCAVALSGLKALELDIQFQLDAALLHIRKATAIWKQMLQCGSCKRGNPEEAVYMSVSGVRAALRYLSAVFAADVDRSTTDASSGSLYFDPSQGLPTPQETPPPPRGDCLSPPGRAIGKSALGGYEMDEEERGLVVKLIALRLVREMRDVLETLDERIHSQRATTFWLLETLTPQPSAWGDDLFHLQPLLRGVKETASSLQETLCNSSTAELQRCI